MKPVLSPKVQIEQVLITHETSLLRFPNGRPAESLTI